MNPYLRVLFFVVMTALFGACAVLILGILLGISDKLFGTNLVSLINIIISGGEIVLLKVWLIGLPISFLTKIYNKRWKKLSVIFAYLILSLRLDWFKLKY